ncbi:MAG: T9SS type A sorting domain-containing protein [Flavobacteriales bacterium]|nr:T9SS type A sorting domain-containing protein [Flavobacteriales bacterium]
MKRIYTLVFASLFALSAFAQPGTDQFPNFTYEDIDGVEHTLYDYLDNNQIVLIDVFTTWCPNCVTSLPSIEQIDEEKGAQGDGTVTILKFERDASTNNEEQWASTHNSQNPIITGAEDIVADLWNIPYQPAFFVICPDRTWTLEWGTQTSADPLLDIIDECDVNTVSVEEESQLELSVVSPVQNNQLEVVLSSSGTVDYEILDLTGKIILKGQFQDSRNTLDVSALGAGQYLIKITENNQHVVKRFVK